MKPLAQAFGRKPSRSHTAVFKDWPLPYDLMGIEVEVECHNNNGEIVLPVFTSYSAWEEGRDGSLLNGTEYKLHTPLAGDALSMAIEEFFNGTALKRSTTSSTHLHINMMDESTTTGTVQNLVMLVYMLEAAIYAYAQPAREWCGYTNSLSTAPDELLAVFLSDTIDSNEAKLRSTCNNGSIGRYYGLNLQSLSKYGSVEFRYFPTCTSKDELIDWICLVQSFKRAAASISSLQEIESFLRNEETYSDFLSRFFSKWYDWFARFAPLDHARRSYNRAMAVCHAKNTGQRAPRFVANNVRKNKKISKFFRARRKEVEALMPDDVVVYFYDSNLPIPNSRSSAPSTLLVESNVVYVGGGSSWNQSGSGLAAFERRNYDLDELEVRMLAALDAHVQNVTVTEDRRTRMAASIERFTSVLREYRAMRRREEDAERRAAEQEARTREARSALIASLDAAAELTPEQEEEMLTVEAPPASQAPANPAVLGWEVYYNDTSGDSF